MSSRALRRAQKQREEEEHLKRLQEEEDADESSDDEVDTRPQQSAFALLNAEEEDEELDKGQHLSDAQESPEESLPEPKPVPKRKNRKKRNTKSQQAPHDTSLDDIDAALKTLATIEQPQNDQNTPSVDPATAEACHLLAVDSQNLHAENEMKRLFGRAAMESNDEDQQQQGGAGRRRNRQQMGGLAAALGRRQGAQGGRSNGLGLLGLRRNLFVQGKEEWPVGTAGGLGMEIAEKREDGTVEYKFVHNTSYQDVQADFEICVRGMDPERMIRLLQLNPYHISTLLQVSEIAKQERDHTTSGDLLERALFSLGRALHSTFAGNLAQGKARMDFRRPENREFWLAVSRYMTNLSMRATWRTVFEWAKLLLSLDPSGDPYRMCLSIDQYALRARQPQQLLDMAANPLIGTPWKSLPNMQLSLALAHVQAGNASKGKQILFTAANRSPWALAALFQALNLDAPPGIWGTSPRTDWEKLMTELYATRAKDLWASPESQSLLTEVAAAVSGTISPSPPDHTRQITLDDSRHVILADIPTLIALLPRDATAKLTSASDPLPPPDEVHSYTPRGVPASSETRSAHVEMQTLLNTIGRLMPTMRGLLAEDETGEVTEAHVEAALEDSGMTRAELDRTMGRFNQLMGVIDRGRMAEEVPDEEQDDLDEVE